MVLVVSALALCCSAHGQQAWQLDSFGDQPTATVPTREQLSEVKVDPATREQVRLLDDSSFAVRQEAMHALLERTEDLDEIYAILEFDDLSPEQRYRLLSVVRNALVRTPRGAIGISMNPVQFNAGGPVEIRIIDLIPGLPGERVLKIGDRIIEVDDRPLHALNDLQIRVQSKKPGDKVRLKIKRTRVDEQDQPILDDKNQLQVEIMDVEVELGSADRLGEVRNQANFPSPVQQQRQIEAIRIAETYAPRPQPIDVKGGAQSLLVATSKSLRGNQEDVEQYPAIQLLKLQRNRLGFGDAAQVRAMRLQWQQGLMELHDIAQNPELTPEERGFFQRVIERYLELMQP